MVRVWAWDVTTRSMFVTGMKTAHPEQARGHDRRASRVTFVDTPSDQQNTSDNDQRDDRSLIPYVVKKMSDASPGDR